MRAEMDANGVITITAETGAEAFALKYWSERAHVAVSDPSRNETHYLRSSMLIVDCNAPGADRAPYQV